MAHMAEGTATGSADPANEAVATTGLFLLMTAIISLAFALANWGAAETTMAVLFSVLALMTFATSIACFISQTIEETAA